MKLTIEDINKEIKNLDPNVEPGTDTHLAYTVLLSAITLVPFTSADDVLDRTSDFIGGNTKLVKIMCHRAMRNRVIRYGKRNEKKFLCVEVYTDNMGFALGANILLGYMRRVKNEN